MSMKPEDESSRKIGHRDLVEQDNSKMHMKLGVDLSLVEHFSFFFILKHDGDHTPACTRTLITDYSS